MKKILILLLLLVSLLGHSTNYYLHSGGSDSNTGAIGQPWQTIAKVNSVWATGGFNAGDSILFARNQEFSGTLNLIATGNSGVIIGAYGTGEKPIISGVISLDNWVSNGANVYAHKYTAESSPNLLLINGTQFAKGRFPNTGWLTVDSHVGTTTMTDAAISSSTLNCTAAELVIRKNPYIIDRCLITNHVTSTFTYTNLGSTVEPTNGWGYFVQGKKNLLDVEGEWSADIDSIYLYYNSDPSEELIFIPIYNKGIVVNNNTGITIRDLNIFGYNTTGIEITSATCVIDNCTVSYSGRDGIIFASQSGTIKNSYVCDIAQSAIYTQSSFIDVLSNRIERIGLVLGSSYRGDYAVGLFATGADNLYQYNEIDSVGYNGIYLAVASRSIVRNNFINHACLNTNDGGGIYTAGTTSVDRVIDGNIILNTIGSNSGTPETTIIVEGIYIDEPTSDIDITNNTSAFNTYSGLKLHNTNNIRVRGNIFFGNGVTALRLQGSNTTYPLRNNDFHGNKFIAKSATELCIKHISNANDITLLGSLDSNYYARPVADNTSIQTGTPSAGTVNRTLESWKSFSGQDSHSNKSPIVLTDSRDIAFRYNPTASDSLLNFEGERYYLIDGSRVTDTLTIAAYSSVVLLRDNSYDPTPEILATVYLYDSLNIASRQITISALVSNDGGGTISEKGIVYSTSANPTTANNKIVNGSGLGSYTSLISGLTNSTTYYFRAYAINEAGTSYSNQIVVATRYSSTIKKNGYTYYLDGKSFKY